MVASHGLAKSFLVAWPLSDCEVRVISQLPGGHPPCNLASTALLGHSQMVGLDLEGLLSLKVPRSARFIQTGPLSDVSGSTRYKR